MKRAYELALLDGGSPYVVGVYATQEAAEADGERLTGVQVSRYGMKRPFRVVELSEWTGKVITPEGAGG